MLSVCCLPTQWASKWRGIAIKLNDIKRRIDSPDHRFSPQHTQLSLPLALSLSPSLSLSRSTCSTGRTEARPYSAQYIDRPRAGSFSLISRNSALLSRNSALSAVESAWIRRRRVFWRAAEKFAFFSLSVTGLDQNNQIQNSLCTVSVSP